MTRASVFAGAGLRPPYATVVADPPWRPPWDGSGRGTRASEWAGAKRRYATMTVPELCALPVAELAAADSYLWLWAINAMMAEAHEVVRAWNFQPITVLTWCKPGPGVGNYLRNNTEHVILAKRGKPPVPNVKPPSTWYVWPRGPHSTKPAAFGDLVEAVCPGPYVELFARQPRLGWDSWGHGHEHRERAS